MKEVYAVDAMPSKRWKDPATGYLHIKDNKLTRAQVDGYYGKEIMGSQNAGLEPDRLYQVFRPLPEILKGAQVFSGSPVMEEHPEGDVNAETLAKAKENYWERDKIPVGSVFNIREDGEYLLGDIVIYNKATIDAIEQGEKKQLSCGYVYQPFIESGLYEGKPYDIVMKDIKYNHIALVAKGRVGPEVRVSDSAAEDLLPSNYSSMKKADRQNARLKEKDSGERQRSANIELLLREISQIKKSIGRWKQREREYPEESRKQILENEKSLKEHEAELKKWTAKDEIPNIRKVEKVYPSSKPENNGKNNTAGKKPSDQAAGKKFWDELGGRLMQKQAKDESELQYANRMLKLALYDKNKNAIQKWKQEVARLKGEKSSDQAAGKKFWDELGGRLMNEKGKGSDAFGGGPGRDIVLARRILELEKAMSMPKDIEWAQKVIQSAKTRMNDPTVKKLMTEPVRQFDSEGKNMVKLNDADDPILEGEENGAIQQIKEGVENFEGIHEREGYLPPEGLDETPQGNEAGTPELGAPNPVPAAEDEFPPKDKSKANDGPKYEAAKQRAKALRAKADQMKNDLSKYQMAWERANQAAVDFENALARMNVNDESPEGTIPVGEGSDEFPEPNDGCEFKGVAMDGKKMFDKISRALDEKYRRRDQALDEVRPLVGQLKFTAAANDAAVYTYALKQKGIEPPKNINVEGLRGMVQALLVSINRNASALSAATAFDAAPKAKADEYEKLLDSAKTRVL